MRKNSAKRKRQLALLTLALVTLGGAILRDIVPANLLGVHAPTLLDYVFTTVSGLLCTAAATK